jgi:DNA polymerase III sliding clamp (beta) subunit (PCNA family)
VDTGDGAIRILSGTVAVKLRMIDGVFPTIEPFDNAGLADSGDFSQRVSQVAWAVARDSSILSGVHVDGHHLIACDRQVAALIPCVVPLPRPVTVPLTAISSILKNASDVRIGATDRNLLIQLDQETQATTKLYEGAYPDVKALKRADFIGKVNLPRTQMVEAISRMMVVAKSERLPVIKMTLNYGIVKSCVLDLQVADTGHRIQDTLDVTGDFSDPFEIFLSPAMLVNALENARDESVLMEFGHSDPTKTSLASIRFTDTKDYEVLLQPRKP